MEPVTFRLVAQCLNHLRHRLPQNTEVRHIKSTKLCYHLEDLLTYLLTYLLTPRCRVVLEKLTGLQLVKKFPAFRGTRRFITALTSLLNLFNKMSPEQASRMWMFRIISVLQGGVVSTSPNPEAGGPPLVGCPRLLIQSIRSYPPYRRPFLYPQPEDAPCRGDRDPLHGNVQV